jgi:hypothetical protein
VLQHALEASSTNFSISNLDHITLQRAQSFETISFHIKVSAFSFRLQVAYTQRHEAPFPAFLQSMSTLEVVDMSHSAREDLKPVMTFELMKLPRELRIMLRDRIYGHMVVRDHIKITTTLLLLQHSADATNNIREVCIDDEIEASSKDVLCVCIQARLRRSRRTPRNRVRQVHPGLLKDLTGRHFWETYRISDGVIDPPLLNIFLANV